MSKTKPIDWHKMHPMTKPEDLDSVDRAQLLALQQPDNANVPIPALGCEGL